MEEQCPIKWLRNHPKVIECHGKDASALDIMGFLNECDVIHEEHEGSHRHYDTFQTVVDVDGKMISYTSYGFHSEMSSLYDIIHDDSSIDPSFVRLEYKVSASYVGSDKPLETQEPDLSGLTVIKESRLKQLEGSEAQLDHLHANGVDNWEWYSVYNPDEDDNL